MHPSPLFSDPTAAPAGQPPSGYPVRPEPAEALARLRAGNFRFALGPSRPGRAPGASAELRPYAVVVGCIDARVPVEAVFEQDIGAICVVRSAGHVLDRAVVGSVEFAVTELRVSLVIVLGHEDCRAVASAIAAVRGGGRVSGARRFLIDQIVPAVQAGPAGGSLDQITRAHIRRTVAALGQPEHLADALAAGRIDILGAIYRLDNGHVDIL